MVLFPEENYNSNLFKVKGFFHLNLGAEKVTSRCEMYAGRGFDQPLVVHSCMTKDAVKRSAR
jgi:hypothetical protein